MSKPSAATTVGRLELQATGSLVISRSGRYAFNGMIGVQQEYFRFPASERRTWWAETSTTIGRSFPGKIFRVHVIGTKPFAVARQVTGRKVKN